MHIRGRAAVESLESRRQLSVTFVASKETLDVTGTAGDDEISVRPNANLINVIDVVIRNANGREARSVAVGKVRTLRVFGGDGNDRITLDPKLAGLAGDVTCWLDGGAGDDRVWAGALPGTVALRAGNDAAYVDAISDATFYGRVKVFGDAGDDRIEAKGKWGGRVEADGGAGRDTLVAGAGAHTLHGGAGDDSLRADVRGAILFGDDGNDFVHLVSGGRSVGGPGDDVLKGGAGTDNLEGGDGDDTLIAGGGSGDALDGGNGDDVLDGNDSRNAELDGGPGDDDLYAGIDTRGIGGDGRDWFEKATWLQTDRDADDREVPNTPIYGAISGSSGVNIGRGVYDGVLTVPVFATPLYLVRLSDLGFVVSTNASGGSRTIGEARTPDDYRPTPALTAKERKGTRTGIVRLPRGWAIDLASAAYGGSFVWYDVRGSGEGNATSSDFGPVFQLVVKAGTVLVTEAAATSGYGEPIVHARGDVASLWLSAGAKAQIAGGPSTRYRLSSALGEELRLTPPTRGQRGILVDGGVLWLAAGEAPTTFVAWA